MGYQKLSRDFYNRNTLDVARDLLGKFIVHNINGEKIVGKIVEVEAYMGPEDKAAHSYGYRMTERNRVMFGPPGHAYVFIIYGMYQCLNVVTEPEGVPRAVLIRAVEPIEGYEIMAQNRYNKNFNSLSKRQMIDLTNGPGKLCIALGINKQYNGVDLCENLFYVESKNNKDSFEIIEAPRININYAEEYIHCPWRFYIRDNPYVSKLKKI